MLVRMLVVAVALDTSTAWQHNPHIGFEVDITEPQDTLRAFWYCLERVC